MLLPDLWELFAYWEEHPPTHIILAARYLDPKRSGRVNDFEKRLVAEQVGGVKSFDNLPLAVQAALSEAKKNG